MLMPAHVASANEYARYFPSTGHSVGGAFLKFFDAYGGVRVFGLPLTGEVQEGGRTVQYFERQRFEYHPASAGTQYEVQLSLLGTRAAEGKPGAGRVAPFTNKKDLIYVKETGHSLSGAFLSFWRNNGGVRVLGYPITEPVQENDLTVQYFERARMEYHPEKAKQGFVVELSLLGRDTLWTGGGGAAISSGAIQQGQVTSTHALTADEQDFLNRINGARAAGGIQPLSADPVVSSLAVYRSNDMVAKGYFSHTPPGGDTYMNLLKSNGIAFQFAGEIIAWNNFSNTVQKAFEGFMNSPTHRAIIMDGRFNFAGIGQAKDAKGNYFYTIIFVQK